MHDFPPVRSHGPFHRRHPRPSDALYEMARRACEDGQIEEGRALYLRCLADDPAHAEANHDLGVLAAHAGDDETSRRLFERAIDLDPHHPDAHANLCLLLTRAGRFEDAVLIGHRAVRLNPEAAHAHINLGGAFEAGGDIEAAVRCYEDALAAHPGHAAALLKLGAALRRLGRLERALACLDLSIGIDAGHYGAHVIRGLLRDAFGDDDGGTADFSRAFALCPPSVDAHKNLGVICIDQGRLDLAVAILRRAIEIDPADEESHGNLGLALQRQGRLREAFGAYVRTVTLNPRQVMAQCNLGSLLADLGELAAAVSTCRLAARIDPASTQAHVNLAVALRRQDRNDEAIGAFREALRLRPTMGEALVELCDLRQQACDWPGLAQERAAALAHSYREGRRVAPFQILTLTDAPEEQQAAARVWAGGFSHRAASLAAYAPRSFEKRAGRIRLGYLSADFRTHATAMLVAELFERHDRSRFELFGYSCGEDDGSEMRHRLVRAFDRFVDLRPLSHAEAAAAIRADGIDILIDLKGYTREARTQMLALRPAPIQVNFLGFPGTMGAGFIDYIIADAVVIPPGQEAAFDEKVVRLPHAYQPNDSRRSAATRRPTRDECGLPAQGFVFCCFNNSYKVTEEIFAIWMRLLHAAPDSVLWLYEAQASMAGNLRREAALAGIAPGRLVFAPRIVPEDHLARLGLADLFMDTVPVNAHTTASEALWAGLPVLTCAGRSFAARVAASLLGAVGLPDLVTTSLLDYEAVALSLARHPDRLARLRARLAEARHTAPLFDTPRYTRGFETALVRMVDLMDQGERPESFAVEAD